MISSRHGPGTAGGQRAQERRISRSTRARQNVPLPARRFRPRRANCTRPQRSTVRVASTHATRASGQP